MRRLLPVALLLLLAACSQSTNGAFTEVSPSPSGPAPQARLDIPALSALRNRAAAAMVAHLSAGTLELGWPGPAGAPAAGPYADAAPEADAAAAQALKSLALTPAPGVTAPAPASSAGAVESAFRQLQGPRGGAYLLLADAAHPPSAAAPYAVDPTPAPCPSAVVGPATTECLRRHVSDELLATWYATDSKSFFKVGETSTVYRPVDAIAVGSALVVSGFQLHDEHKIEAGSTILAGELKSGVDAHFGLLSGLETATAQGGRSTTDYRAHLADQAGAAEALLEAFDASREQAYMAAAKRLLQPLMDENVSLRTPSGGYIEGFDLQSAGPTDGTPADVLATLLILQAAHHYDRDDGGHFAHLEETASTALMSVLEADHKQGGDTAGLPTRVAAGTPAAPRSGLVTALAVTVIGDLLRDAQGTAPAPGASPSL